MAYDAYLSAALLMRYGLTALGAFIAGRAAYMSLRDCRNAARIRACAKETGVLAELSVTANGQARKCALQREGAVGAGIGADIRLTGMKLKRRHFYYEIINGNLVVTSLKHSTLKRKRSSAPVEKLVVKPGGRFFAEDALFRFIMYRQKAAPLSPMTLRAYGAALNAVLGRQRKANEYDERAKPPGSAEKPANPRK